MNEIRSSREANRFFNAWRKHPRNSCNPERDSFLRFASSAEAPRHAGICRHLQIVVKDYRLCGGAEWIRTLGAVAPQGANCTETATLGHISRQKILKFSRLSLGFKSLLLRQRVSGFEAIG